LTLSTESATPMIAHSIKHDKMTINGKKYFSYLLFYEEYI